MEDSGGRAHTDLDIGALVVGNARVGGACDIVSPQHIPLWGNSRILRTKIDADGTLVDFVAHDCGMCRRNNLKKLKSRKVLERR